MPALDSEQRKIVKAIVTESRQIADPVARRKFKRAAVQTGLVESNLRNLSYGDADSQGWRQERTSIYGAGATGATNVKASVRRFREEFLQHYDPGERASDVAGQVQRPASQYLGRYQERAGEARAILGGYGGAGGGGQPARTSGRPDTLKITPGVDRSAERQVMLQGYLAERGKPGALLALKSGLDDTADLPGYQEVIPGRPGKQRQSRRRDSSSTTAEQLGDETQRYATKQLGLPEGSRDRDPARNAQVGGSPTSDHLEGPKGQEAVDLPTTPDEGGWEQYRKVVRELGGKPAENGFSEFTIKRGGKRFRVQAIFGPEHGHGDHIHVGFRRVR